MLERITSVCATLISNELIRLIFSLIFTFILSFVVPTLLSFLSINVWIINIGCAPCYTQICPAICFLRPSLNWLGLPVIFVGFIISFLISGSLQKKTNTKFPIITFFLFLIPIVTFYSFKYFNSWRGTCRVFRANQLNVEPYWKCHSFWNPFSWNEDLHTLYDPQTGLRIEK